MPQPGKTPSLPSRRGLLARTAKVVMSMAVLAQTSACSDDRHPTSPESRTDWPVVILPQRAVYHGSVPVQFTVSNVGTAPLQMGMCADGLQLFVLSRWIDVAGRTECFLALLDLPPGAARSVVYGLNAELPDGRYRGRFQIWERGNGERALPAQFSAPFTLKRQFEPSGQ